MPNGALDPKVNPSGEVSPKAITFAGGIVKLFAPISPGPRQLSYAYQLPRGALPLSLAIDEPTGVLEVLLEEPTATVSGGNLSEVAPTTTAGRSFRRFLAQNVPAPSVVRVDVPFTLGASRSRYFVAIGVVCGLAMLTAIVVATRQRRPKSVTSPRPADALLHAIATLDARFEQRNGSSSDARAEYEAERARLKAQLAAVLAEEGQPR
jgi:hypothetical protein